MTMLLAAILAMAMQAGSAVTTIARDDMSGIDTARQAVVRTATDWARLWREHGGAGPAPAVDFKTRAVVAVFLGTRPTPGYVVEITGTRKDGAGLVVEWREQRPARDAILAQVLTSPAHIASIPAFPGDIRFEKIDR